MPVRSLTSSVLTWPSREAVESAARSWCFEAVRGRSDVRRIGYLGSYANGTAGVGSDLDIVIVVDESDLPFVRRALEFTKANGCVFKEPKSRKGRRKISLPVFAVGALKEQAAKQEE